MTNKTSRAGEDLLDELHGVTATGFLEEIRKYRHGEYTDKDGAPLPVPAALLAQAAKFLKDNGVDRPVRPGDPEDLLKDELPEFGDNITPINRSGT